MRAVGVGRRCHRSKRPRVSTSPCWGAANGAVHTAQAEPQLRAGGESAEVNFGAAHALNTKDARLPPTRRRPATWERTLYEEGPAFR